MIPGVQKKHDFSLKNDKGEFKKGFAEVNSGEQMTIVSESYTIREMIDKFVTGVLSPLAMQRNGETSSEYTDDVMNSDAPEFVDKVDVQEYVESVNQRLTKAKKIEPKGEEPKSEPKGSADGNEPKGE